MFLFKKMNNLKISDIYFHMLKHMASKKDKDVNNYLNDLITKEFTEVEKEKHDSLEVNP